MPSTPSQAEIAELIKAQTYNPSIVPLLEAYLHAQANPLNPSPYFFDANRILVKQYSFFPKLVNVENIALVQLLALVYGNCEGRVDFGALSCLIPESSKKGETFSTMARCSELFNACQFHEFWATYKSICSLNSESYPSVNAFSNSSWAKANIRKDILDIFSLTYRSASISDALLASLDFVNEAELVEFFKVNRSKVEKIVESVEHGKVLFCARTENTKKVKVFQKSVDYGVIRGLLAGSGQ